MNFAMLLLNILLLDVSISSYSMETNLPTFITYLAALHIPIGIAMCLTTQPFYF